MKKNKVIDKIKKIIICLVCSVTLVFGMPVKSRADVLTSFINILLYIPDALMYALNNFIAQTEEELTGWEMEYQGTGEGSNLKLSNFEVTPYDIFTSGATVHVSKTETTSAQGDIDDSSATLTTNGQNFLTTYSLSWESGYYIVYDGTYYAKVSGDKNYSMLYEYNNGIYNSDDYWSDISAYVNSKSSEESSHTNGANNLEISNDRRFYSRRFSYSICKVKQCNYTNAI